MEDHIELVNNRVIVSTTWLCTNMEISRVTLGNWVAKGCPQLARGRFDLVDVLNWRGVLSTMDAGIVPLYKQEGADEDDEPDNVLSLQQQKLAAEVRYKRAQAELGEMRNAISSGKYVARDELEAEISTLFVGIRRAVLAIPRRIAGLIAGHVGRIEAAEIEAQCDGIARNALARLSAGNLTPIRTARIKNRAQDVEVDANE